MKNSNKPSGKWGFRDILKDYSFWVTLTTSVLIASLGNQETLRSVMVSLGTAMVEISAALLGIVLAGLAIFLAFMDKKYLALIEQIFGVGNELFPIKVTAITAILCLSFGLGLILVGNPPNLLFRLILVGALWSASYLLWQIYELVKWLVEHAKARAMQIRKEDKDEL
ncbi:MAG: hypothetical protein R6U93_05885 [Dehalococcoidia bacterium]